MNRPVPTNEVPDEGDVVDLDAALEPKPVVEVLDAIAQATGWNIVASPGVEEKKVRFWLKGAHAKELLEVLRFNGVYYDFDEANRFLYVMTDTEYLDSEYGETVKSEFDIRHADVLDIQSILTTMLSSTGRIVPDPRTGKIFVWDTADNIRIMEQTVTALDVPLAPRVFNLNHLEASKLLETVTALLSERGVAHVDPRVNALVITDLPSRQEQIAEVVEALDVALETRTWTLNYADAEIVLERLEGMVPEEMGTVTINELTHQVTVTAIPERIAQIDQMIQSWDVKGRQVQIEAYLVAAQKNVTREFGIDWSYFDEIAGVPFAIQSGQNTPDYTASPEQGQRFSVGRLPYREFYRDGWGRLYQFLDDANNNEAAPIPDDPEYILDPDFKGNRVAVVLNYLDRQGALSVLARPRVTVQDGQEAIFENTTDRAFQSVGYTTQGVVVDDNSDVASGRVVPGQIQFIPVGTILKVLPRINGEENVLMDIEAEDSTAEDKIILAGGLESTVPEKTQSKAETQILVRDGQTIVIGGLRATSIGNDVDRVPVLGDIPLVGRLFKTTSRDNQERELIIFITPTIVDEFTQPEATTIAQVDADAADELRRSQKNVWQRMEQKITGNANEISVSIGEAGTLYSEGHLVTLEALRKRFFEAAAGKVKPTVIVRAHPNAPARFVTDVSEAAMEAGLRADFEASRPFVPVLPENQEVVSPDGTVFPQPVEPETPAAPDPTP